MYVCSVSWNKSPSSIPTSSHTSNWWRQKGHLAKMLLCASESSTSVPWQARPNPWKGSQRHYIWTLDICVPDCTI